MAEAREKIAKYGEEIQYTHNEVVAKENKKNQYEIEIYDLKK